MHLQTGNKDAEDETVEILQAQNQLAAIQIANMMQIINTCVYILRCNSKQTATKDAEEETVSILQVSNQIAALQTTNVMEIIISSVYNFRYNSKEELTRQTMKTV